MSSKWVFIRVRIQTRVQTRTRKSWTRKDSDSSLKKIESLDALARSLSGYLISNVVDLNEIQPILAKFT